MLLSKASLAIKDAASNDPMDKTLNGLHVDVDGTTVASNGTIILAVGPVQESLVEFPVGKLRKRTAGAAFTLRREQVDQVLKNIPKDKRQHTQFALLTESDDPNKVELTTVSLSGLEQKVAMPPMFGQFPAWKDTIRGLRGKDPIKVCVNRKMLIDLLKIMDDASPDRTGQFTAWIEVNSERNGLIIRCQNTETGQRIMGGIACRMVDESKWLSLDFWEQKVLGILRKILSR